MFDNPQQETKKMSKKLRPIKMSDEDFELFYKEIYAEFGPKGVPAFDPKAQVEEPVAEEIPAEPVIEEIPQVVSEDEINLVIPQEAPEEEINLVIPEEPVYSPAEEVVLETNVKAAAVICDVQEDELMEEQTEEVPKKKKKGVAGLVITLVIECLAIAGVAAYWLFHIL